MKIIRKREVILEHERRVTIKFKDESSRAFCLECETPAPFVTIDEAAGFCATTSRRIFGLVEARRIHFQETKRGNLLICLASLTNLPDENKKFLSQSSE